jgi:hypothetical protein
MATGNAFAPVHIVLLGYKSAREIINRKGEYNRYVS